MRIAFFGLAYHARTASSRFILDLLAQHGAVDSFVAEADPADLARQASGFDESRYDAILVWQLHEAFSLLSGRHPNVTFAPMYDAMFRGGAFRWRQRFGTAKILCFSWALRQEVMRRAPVHHHVQYYPEAGARSPAADDPALRGFLWYRHRGVTPQRILALTAGTPLARLGIHDAPDPGHAIAQDWPVPAHVAEVVRTAWSADRGAFDAQLAAANLFFASRPLEGIGMSFLEAMAAGLCVVAPDAPTMNEYISHGRNGLLYAPDRMAPLDLSTAQRLGAAARESVLRGRARWDAGIPALQDFLLTPRAALGRRLHPATAPATPGLLAVAAPGEALPPAEWVILRPAGDAVLDSAAVDNALAAMPPSVAAVTGHYLQVAADGTERLVRPAEPGAAWARLLEGEVGPDGPLGMPASAATAFRRAALVQLGGDPPVTGAALFDRLLALRELGLEIAEAECVLARQASRGEAEIGAWSALLRRRAGEGAATGFASALAAARAAAASRHRAARLALGLVSALDGVSPGLADRLEGLMLGGALRRLRRRLGGARPA